MTDKRSFGVTYNTSVDDWHATFGGAFVTWTKYMYIPLLTMATNYMFHQKHARVISVLLISAIGQEHLLCLS